MKKETEKRGLVSSKVVFQIEQEMLKPKIIKVAQ